MRISQLWIFVLMLLLPQFASAQFHEADINELNYRSENYWGHYQVFLEIKPNGVLKMYNTAYDHVNTDNFAKLQQGGSRVISIEKLQESLLGDTSAYYIGKIAHADYQSLIDLIIKVQADTTNNISCCCDIPYRQLNISFKNGEQNFMDCDRNGTPRVIELMNILNKIAGQPGYRKSSVPLKFEKW